MAWADEHGIGARLERAIDKEDRLPLVLCGPILRRTEPDSVTVWVALKESCTVTLRVYSHAPPPFLQSLREELQGTRQTVRLGAHLHIVAVTARPVEAERQLAPGTVYFYNLFFGPTGGGVVPETADEHLNTPDVVDLAEASSLGDLQPTSLSYSFEHRLPSFSLPPEDLNKLRIIHGTCRKPDGPGLDALPALDVIISDTWPVADERPHLLLLNGDQIYSDDVADSMLFFLMDADKALLGWSETLPRIDQGDARLKPGKRKGIVRGTAEFTTEDPEGHLLRLGEYFAMYLFTWSDALWPLQFPDFKEVTPKLPISGEDSIIQFNLYKKEFSTLDTYRKALREVRRVLANVPSYMMFDDHDITDDWNMLRDWCERIYANLLARRIVQNALLAYAVFQAWGNTPERFDAGQPGEALLAAAAQWSDKQGNDANSEEEIARLVGIPGTLSADGQVTGLLTRVGDFFQLSRASDALRWDFAIRGPKFEILMLDSRTRREFPLDDRFALPSHLGPAALEEQIPLDDIDPDKLFVVVATTNVLTIPVFHGTEIFGSKFVWEWWYVVSRLIEFLLSRDLLRCILGFSLYNPDLNDSWKPQTRPFEALLSRLARRAAVVDNKRNARVLFLSGDVHFSWAARMQYWADRPFETDDDAAPVEAIFAHLTSSALKKEDGILGVNLHKWGYIPMTDKLPGAIRWFGWKESSALGVSPQDLGRKPEWAHMSGWMRRRRPPMLALKDAEETRDFIPRPDWRYRIDFILGEKSGINFNLGLLEKPDPADHENWLKVVNEAHNRHKNYAQKWGDGIEIVGRNNLSELRFQWSGRTGLASNIAAADDSFKVSAPDLLPSPPLLVKIGNEIIKVGAVHRGTGVCSEVARAQHGTQAAAHVAGAAVEVFKTATQTHWWRLTGETQLLPLTRYTISLDYFDPLFPKPKLPGEADS
ncbi:MAG: hypothetical protein M3410_10305 [Acidobacteriota bacterium]|nr:hypothetical protein [Acidobacteriota bacterium]